MSWYLGATDLGKAVRQDNFRADPALPSGWYQVKPSNYSGYGFDRGHNCLYIICGSYGRGGTGSMGYQTTIASGRVTVHSNCWKVVVVLPTGNNDVSRVTSGTRVITVNTPNNNSLSSAWGGYLTTVDAIEAALGLNILSALPLSVQNVVEARVDTGPTN